MNLLSPEYLDLLQEGIGLLKSSISVLEKIKLKKMEEINVRPPLGIIPEYIWKEQRMYELKAAITRYAKYDPAKIDPAWLTELIALEEWYKLWQEENSKTQGR